MLIGNNRVFLRVSLIITAIVVSAASAFAQSWAVRDTGEKVDLVASYFTSANRGFVGGDGGYLASTNDGGATWTKYPLNTKEDVNEIYFRNEDNGYIVAGKLVYSTTDGGQTWQQSRIVSDSEFKGGTPVFSSIRYSDKKRGLAIGSIVNKRDEIIDSLVMRTSDGGDSWQRVVIPTKNELFHLDFNGNSHGWIVGDKGLVLATTDSGETWKIQVSGVTRALFAVDFRDDNDGVAVGGGGTIIRTTNGGQTWENVITPFKETLKRVAFSDDSNGWAVGHKGTILRTADKGRSWGRQSSPASLDFYGLFISKRYGCAVGEAGTTITFQR